MFFYPCLCLPFIGLHIFAEVYRKNRSRDFCFETDTEVVAVPASDLQRVGLDAYREIVVNDTALPHTFDGDGSLTRHFGEPDGVCYIVVGDAVPAVEVGFGMWGNDGLFARPVDFGQSLLSNLLKTVQRVSQYDAVVVIDITRGSHQQGVGVDLGKYRVFAGKARVVVKWLFQSGSEAPF